MFLSDTDYIATIIYFVFITFVIFTISILPVMSKIFERHVHLALHEYLNQLGLLFKYQSGFRLFYSCETAMIELVDRLLMNMDNGLLTGLSLIDFRKAFDLDL